MPTSFELWLKRAAGSAIGSAIDELDRRITLTQDSAVVVGRASKTEHKQLLPAVDNAWIRNPVISRTHAEFYVDDFFGKPGVFLRDLKSSHGTWVNGKNIGAQKYALISGDRVQFGTDVSRGEEMFRPPLYDVSIVTVNPKSIPDSQANFGTTYSLPAESDDSEDISDAESDAGSDVESHSSVNPLDSVPPPQNKPLAPPGSQYNPLTFDNVEKVDPINNSPPGLTRPVTEFAAVAEDPFSDSESNASNSGAISEHMVAISDSSSDSESSSGSDRAEEENEAQDIEEDGQVEEDYFSKEQAVENEEGDEAEAVATTCPESPRYAPKSPPAYRPFGYVPYDVPEQGNIYTPAHLPPLPAYHDGPFIYGTGMAGPSAPKTHLQDNFVGAPILQFVEEITDTDDFQAWLNEYPAAPQPPSPFTFAPPPSGTAPTAATLTPRGAAEITKSTSDFMRNDGYARPSNKNDMSIDNLINPPADQLSMIGPLLSLQTSNAAGKKRKADELLDELFDVPDIQASAPATDPEIEDSTSDAPTSQDTAANAPADPAKSARFIAQPMSKKRKLAYGIGCAAVGTVFGMVGTFATLMSLPDNIFQ